MVYEQVVIFHAFCTVYAKLAKCRCELCMLTGCTFRKECAKRMESHYLFAVTCSLTVYRFLTTALTGNICDKSSQTGIQDASAITWIVSAEPRN